MNKVMEFADYSAEIVKATSAYDRPAVQQKCETFRGFLAETDEVCPIAIAKMVLRALRRNRHFGEMQLTADALIQNGQSQAYISRQYGQALIDAGQLALAKQYLAELLDGISGDPAEELEVRGLLGRVHKQMFVASASSWSRSVEHLGTAISWYLHVYESDSANLWHGINAAALLHRAARDKMTIIGTDQPGSLARSIAAFILPVIEDRWTSGDSLVWDFATAAEASVALDRVDDAAKWMQRYAREPSVDAFELASTRRQLTEIWQLRSDSGPGAMVIPILDAELLGKEGGALQYDANTLNVTASTATQESLEALLGRDRYVSYKFMLRALERAKSVAQIRDDTDLGIGTGFVVRGSDIDQQLGDELLLLTNAHVISEDPYVVNPPALGPEEASVVFGTGQELTVREVLWSSPPNMLDATLLSLDGDTSGLDPLPIAKGLPMADGKQRVYIIGHPRGGPLSFSIHDNALIDHEGPPDGTPVRGDVVRLHYRAPTEGGSSGSPVFNSQWRVVGIHHAGGTGMPRLNDRSGTYPANEGLWVQSIRAAYSDRNTG